MKPTPTPSRKREKPLSLKCPWEYSHYEMLSDTGAMQPLRDTRFINVQGPMAKPTERHLVWWLCVVDVVDHSNLKCRDQILYDQLCRNGYLGSPLTGTTGDYHLNAHDLLREYGRETDPYA